MDDTRPTEVDLLSFGTDDEGNAQAVAALYPERFLHTAAHGWLAWTGTHWQAREAEARLHRAIVDMMNRRRSAAVESGYEMIPRPRQRTAGAVKGCKYLLKSILRVSVDDFDTDRDRLNCANGVLDLRSGQLAHHDPSQRFTYVASVPYDPKADQSVWRQFIARAFGNDPDLLAYVREAVGYSLTGPTSEEVVFYLTGPARSGKGTFTETLLAALGWRPLAEEVDFATFTADRTADTQSFDLAGLKPCRLVVASEPSKRGRLNAAKLKALTGGNRVRCAHKYRDFFSYRPQFKIWLSSNYRPNADVDDNAAWGRLRVLLLPNSWLGREDKGLKMWLLKPDNLAGVLAWAAEGARRWYARPNGLEAPACVMGATEKARADLGFVGKWLQERVSSDGDHASFVPNGELYASYEDWCSDNGVSPLSQAGLTQALKAKGLKAGHKKRCAGKVQRGCAGIGLLANDVDG